MIKSVFKFAAWAFMAVCFLTACGSKSVDHNDPQSVAVAALECYDTKDYEGMKALVAPTNTHLLKQCDQMSAIAAENKSDKVYEKKERTFVKATEEFTGAELSENSKSADMEFDGEYPSRVILEKVDRKWYLERFK